LKSQFFISFLQILQTLRPVPLGNAQKVIEFGAGFDDTPTVLGLHWSKDWDNRSVLEHFNNVRGDKLSFD